MFTGDSEIVMEINGEYKFEGRWTVNKEYAIETLTNLIDIIRESVEVRQFNFSIDHELDDHVEEDGSVSKRPTGSHSGNIHIEWLSPKEEVIK